MALNFHLFNCDRTFSLDKVEVLIQRVAAKLSRETKIEKTNFALPRMKELSEKLEKEDSHFDYAVFVVHAHESRLSINERNAGIGYAKVYRALQKVTDDRVLVVIGGDDNYKDQRERDMSVLSRWAWHKICSQFAEDYVNGVKGFIFSWEENHNPIHEEALEFYLDATKRGTQFVPRPKPLPAKVPEKEETKKTEQARQLELLKKQEQESMENRKRLEKERSKHVPLLSEVKKQEPQPIETRTMKYHEKEFPPERNESRALPSRPETSTEHMTDPLQKGNQMESQAAQYQAGQAKQASVINSTPDVHILSFHASQLSVDQVVNVFEDVYKQLSIASKPKSSTNLQINIQDHIMKYKPEYLVLVSEFEDIKDMPHLDNQVQRYKEIVKKSLSVGTKLIFIITEDKKYREGYLSSDAVHSIFTQLNISIPSSEQPMVMSWTKTPWPTHKGALVQLLSPYGKVRAAPQQYGATKQDPTSRVPYTQPEDIPMKRGFYRASISYGRVVQVLMSDPPDWEPDACDLNRMLMKHGSVKKAIIEFWNQGDGLKSAFYPSEAKLSKIAEGLRNDKIHSILVYSYHIEEETIKTVSNFIHHLDVHVHVLSSCQPIEPASLMHEIKGNNPDYVMFSVDADVLENPDEVKNLIREHETIIKGIIENCIGRGVIIMLFGDENNKQGELASNEATQYVRKLTQGIVEPDRLTVMTCQKGPYTTHQDWMKKTLKSKGKKPLASQGVVPSAPQSTHQQNLYRSDKGYLRYKAVISKSHVVEVLKREPPDWTPDEAILNKILFDNKKEKKAFLEIWVNDEGDISSITVETESKGVKQIICNPWESITSIFKKNTP